MQLGIDFGTWNSSATCINGEQLTPIKDPTTAVPSIPSSIFVTPQGQIFVGRSADNRRRGDPLCYRRDIKRDLGLGTPILLGNRTFHVEDLIAQILSKIKRDADAFKASLDQKEFTKAVLTIPATYLEHKRDLMLRAATQAGFRAEEVILLEEPIAASLYYASQNKTMHDGEILLVYDLGGGTFDTALLQKQGDQFRYFDSALPAGIEMCGGIDFDRFIYRDLIGRYPEIQELVREDNTNEAALLARIMIEDLCVELKHQLSEAEEVPLPVVVPGLGRIISHSLTRDAFNQMIEPTIRETISCCRSMINSANIPYEQINRILLVGGSCRIPYVRQLLEQEFQCDVNMASDLELVVCQGAAIHAAMLTNTIKKSLPADGRVASDTQTREIAEKPVSEKSSKRSGRGSYRPLKDPWDL